jgi:peptide/nickel transport system permease protein
MSFFKNIFSNKALDQLEGRILEGEEFSFRKFAWKQFRKNKIALWAYRFLIFLIVLAILAPILANDKPLYCNYKGNTLFPVFSFKQNYEIKNEKGEITEKINIENGDWKQREFESVFWPLISVYAPGKSDISNADNCGPGSKQVFEDANHNTQPMPTRFRHWLGTTTDGGDVMSGLIHGIKFSLLIGILSYLISTLIGITLGSIAGYFGNDTLKISIVHFIFICFGIVLGYFYGFIVRGPTIKNAFSVSGFNVIFHLVISLSLIIGIIFIFHRIGKIIGNIKFIRKIITVPVDSIISRCIEIMNSMPLFVLIISISAIAVPSFFTLVLIIGFTSWTPIARLTRAEFLRIRTLDYIQAGKSFGFSHRRIMFRHALPNALGPSLVAIAFGIAGCILVESSLSFIGVGVPPDVVTWGKLISSAKESISSWWLVIFPGIAIFLTVLMYNLIGEGLRDALDPKLKQ